jgi:hypothetical protein
MSGRDIASQIAAASTASYVDGPYWQALFAVTNDLVSIGHMSGLLVRA